jgi:hypothetical protein
MGDQGSLTRKEVKEVMNVCLSSAAQKQGDIPGKTLIP